MQAVSSDQRYALCLSYSKRHLYSPMGEIREYDGAFIIDLENGEALKLNTEGFALMHSTGAVMSASREALLFSWQGGQPGIWGVPFDGSKPKNWGAELGIKRWANDSENHVAFGQVDRISGNDVTDFDRMAKVVLDREWNHVQDPRYETNPWLLMVFFNAARPIKVYVSNGRADRPENLAWNKWGVRLAFTAGECVKVWEPTREPGEPPMGGIKGQDKAGDF